MYESSSSPRRVQIPGTDFSLFPIGLGTVKAGLTYEGKEVDDLLSLYHSYGGNLLDTARVYSDWIPPEVGRSERGLGEALQRTGLRSKFILMTREATPTCSLPAQICTKAA